MIEKIKQLALKGYSLRDAAKLIGLIKGQVSGLAYRNGIFFRNTYLDKPVPLEERLAIPCKNGHDRKDAYVFKYKSGRMGVHCRICNKEAAKRRREKRRGTIS